jgi:hypothetical protein
MNRRALTGTAWFALCILTACASAQSSIGDAQTRDAASKLVQSPTRPVARPNCGAKVSVQICARVLRYAQKQANDSVLRPASNSNTWPEAVTVVSALRHSGTQRQPNVGPACISGQLVAVDVIGVFGKVGVAPPALQPGQPTPDYTVDDIVITADAVTGRACLVSVRTREAGPAHAPDGATIVYAR